MLAMVEATSSKDSNLRKGPREASGRPERLTTKLTPVPLALEVPATKPRMFDFPVLGKVAV